MIEKTLLIILRYGEYKSDFRQTEYQVNEVPGMRKARVAE